MGNNKIKKFEDICRICKKLHKDNKRVVFCHGFFDILHWGHISLFIRAKRLGDVLIVGVDSYANSITLKRPRELINTDKNRINVISYITPVDYCFVMPTINHNKTPSRNQPEFYTDIYKTLKPDIVASCLATDSDGGLLRIKQAKFARIRFVNIKLKDDLSTSKIVDYYS